MQLLCLGDVAIAEAFRGRDWIPPHGIGSGDDKRVLFNWELPAGTVPESRPRSSGPRLLAAPGSTGFLRRWAPGFASLATNHILDAGAGGLAATIDELKLAGFATVGAGMSRDEISAPCRWETPEGKLSIVNWVFPETHPDIDCVPGPNCWPGPDEAAAIVSGLKKQSDWVLVSAHWSDELIAYPRPEDRVIAEGLVNAGADAVIGHHPHVVRGMEFMASRPVYYSLGNFYFSDIPDGNGGWIVRDAPRNRAGLGVRICFRRGRAPEFTPLPFWRTRGRVVSDWRCRATRRLKAVSKVLRQRQPETYPLWYARRRSRFMWLDYRLFFGVHNRIASLRTFQLLSSLCSPDSDRSRSFGR